MNDEQALLTAISQDPFNDDLRRVWADWLEEHGQADRAELIRVGLELAHVRDDHERRLALYRRQGELLLSHKGEWAAEVIALDEEVSWEFDRGRLFRLELRDGEDDDLAQLPVFPWLLRLGLHGRAFTDVGLRHLARQPNLRWLVLSGTALTDAAVAALLACPRLVEVSCADEELSREALHRFRQGCLRRFDRLTADERRQEAVAFLWAAQAEPRDGPCWDADGKVRETWFVQGGREDLDLKYLEALPEMEEVRLDENRGVTSAGLLPLAGLPKLRRLSLWGTSVTRLHALAGRTSLRALNVGFTVGGPITDDDTAGLETLTELEELDLSGADIGDATLERLRGMHHLRWLSLAEVPRVLGEGLAHLAGLTALRGLWLQGTRISDAGLAQLAGLSWLEHLHLGDTEVSDAGLVHLSGLTRLQTLQFWGPFVPGVSLAALRRLAEQLPDTLIGTYVDLDGPVPYVLRHGRPLEPYRRQAIDQFSIELPPYWEVFGDFKRNGEVVEGCKHRGVVVLQERGYGRMEIHADELRFPDVSVERMKVEMPVTAEQVVEGGPRYFAEATRDPDLVELPEGAAGLFRADRWRFFVAAWVAGRTWYKLTCGVLASRWPEWHERFVRLAQSVRVEPVTAPGS